MPDRIADERIGHMHAPNESERTTAIQEQQHRDSTLHRRNSFEGFSEELVDAISDDDSPISSIKDEEWAFTDFAEQMPIPMVESSDRKCSMGDGDLDIANFPTGQIGFVVEEEDSHRVYGHSTYCLDSLSNANDITEESQSESITDSTSFSEDSCGSPICYNEVNALLATRGLSLFRELSDRPWELRRPSEVEEETRRRTSQSSWGSYEVPSRGRRQRYDTIDWAIVEELKAFRFSSPRRGRRVARPDFPPMSPKTIACKLWPELPDFMASQELDNILHVHAHTQPSQKETNEVQVVQGGSNRASLNETHPKKWFPWWKD